MLTSRYDFQPLHTRYKKAKNCHVAKSMIQHHFSSIRQTYITILTPAQNVAVINHHSISIYYHITYHLMYFSDVSRSAYRGDLLRVKVQENKNLCICLPLLELPFQFLEINATVTDYFFVSRYF